MVATVKGMTATGGMDPNGEALKRMKPTGGVDTKIECLARIAELEAALLPFAKISVLYVDDVGRVTIRVNAADIERAAAVMKLTP